MTEHQQNNHEAFERGALGFFIRDEAVKKLAETAKRKAEEDPYAFHGDPEEYWEERREAKHEVTSERITYLAFKVTEASRNLRHWQFLHDQAVGRIERGITEAEFLGNIAVQESLDRRAD